MKLIFQNKLIPVIIILLLILPEVSGQKWRLRRYEVGFGLGTTQVFGDIGGTADESNWLGLKDIQIDETKLAGEINLRYKLDPLYSVSFHTMIGFGSGSDENSRNDRGRSYTTMISEFSVRMEYFLITEDRGFRSSAVFNKRGMINNYKTFGLYTFIGLGGIYFNPTYNVGTKYKPETDVISGYSKFNLAIPLGLGVRYIVDDQWVVGAELGWRWTGSDFLDGYQQSAASKSKDVYYLFQLTANYRIKTSRRNIPVFLDRSYRRAPKRRKAI